MTDTGSNWCERHAELFRSNGAAPDAVFEQIIEALAKTWKGRAGFPVSTDRDSVVRVINKVSKGKAFCCWLGDAKLHAFLVGAATKFEKAKAGLSDADSNNLGSDETGSEGS